MYVANIKSSIPVQIAYVSHTFFYLDYYPWIYTSVIVDSIHTHPHDRQGFYSMILGNLVNIVLRFVSFLLATVLSWSGILSFGRQNNIHT